jgi:predicted nucleic acid-binding Zn ribbon protein
MRRRNAQSLHDILDEALKGLNIDQKLFETRLITAFPEIVGAGIAAHTKNVYIQKGILYVQMDSPVIRNELQMMRQSLIEHLNRQVGHTTIKNIVFR